MFYSSFGKISCISLGHPKRLQPTFHIWVVDIQPPFSSYQHDFRVIHDSVQFENPQQYGIRQKRLQEWCIHMDFSEVVAALKIFL